MTVVLPPFMGVRRATLADVASIARLSVCANREAWHGVLALPAVEASAPEIALRLLEDLDDGHALYVAGCQGGTAGFAHVTAPMTQDGVQIVELKCIYIAPEHRRRGLGRHLLSFVLRDLRNRSGRPGLRAWAATASTLASFLSVAGGQPVRERWKVSRGTFAVRGLIFDWPARDGHRAAERVAVTAG